MIQEVLKTPEKLLPGLNYRYLHHLSPQLDLQSPRVDDRPALCQEIEVFK